MGLSAAHIKRLTWIADNVSKVLGKLGHFIALRPIVVLIISTICAIGLSVGWIKASLENESLKLWVSQSSKPMIWSNYLSDHFDRTNSFVEVIMKQNGDLDQSNMLTPEGTSALFAVYDELQNLNPNSNPVKIDDKPVSINDICLIQQGANNCVQYGYLKFWNFQYSEYLKSVDGEKGEWIVGDQNKLSKDFNSKKYPDGTDVVINSVFGGFTVDGEQISSAKTVRLTVILDQKRDYDPDDYFDAFEEKMEALQEDERFSDFTIGYNHGTTLDDAIGETVTNDLGLVAAVPFVVLVIALVVLTRRKLSRSQGTLAIYGVLMVFLGIASGYGLCSAIGIKITVLSQVLPFILMGIGVDGVFVLTQSLDEVDRGLTVPYNDVPLRMRKALEKGGASLTATIITDVMAFIFGSFTIIPAVKWFCWQAAITLACTYLLQMTWFISLLVLTERRRVNGKYDCLCCCGVDEIEAEEYRLNEYKKESFVTRAMNAYANVLLKYTVVKIVVVLVFLGLMALGLYGSTQLKEGLPIGDLAAKDHYFQVYDDMDRDTFAKDGNRDVGLYFRRFDQSLPENQAKMLLAKDMAVASDYIYDGSRNEQTWLGSLVEFVKESNPQDVVQVDGKDVLAEGKMKQHLGLFLEQNIQFVQYFDRNLFNNGIEITASYFPISQEAKKDQKAYERKSLNNVLDTVSEINKKLFSDVSDYDTDKGAPVFMYNIYHRFDEQERVIFGSLLQNLGLALVGTFIVNLILLVHPWAAFLMAFCVFLVDVLLLLEMWIFKIPINTISVINLVMAVGLAVDYSVHIAHKFLATPGNTSTDRAKKSVSTIGAAVALGALTTLGGVLPLAFGTSTIFTTFFALLFGTALFGGLVGLVFLPAVLALTGPKQILDLEVEDAINQDSGKSKQLQFKTVDDPQTGIV